MAGSRFNFQHIIGAICAYHSSTDSTHRNCTIAFILNKSNVVTVSEIKKNDLKQRIKFHRKSIIPGNKQCKSIYSVVLYNRATTTLSYHHIKKTKSGQAVADNHCLVTISLI